MGMGNGCSHGFVKAVTGPYDRYRKKEKGRNKEKDIINNTTGRLIKKEHHYRQTNYVSTTMCNMVCMQHLES